MSEPPHPPPPPAGTATPLRAAARWLLMALAALSLVLGIVGIFVPVLPTVPFVLLAAWAAARSSPRLLVWMETHPAFGKMLKEWRRGGVVRRRAKWAATLAMGGSAILMLFVVPTRWIALAVIACMACLLVWLWRRPEQLADEGVPPAR